MIDIEEAALLAELGANGERWILGQWDDGDGGRCLHGAIRACAPIPGDAYIVEQVANRQGWGPAWNDAPERTWPDIQARINGGIHISDGVLAEVFGPQWLEIVGLVRRAATLTGDEAARLAAAVTAAVTAARAAAVTAAVTAAGALVIRDLIGQYGFTQAHYDTLTKPWRKVIGPVHPDDGGIERQLN